MRAVTPARIAEAKKSLVNVDAMAAASRLANLPFHVATTLSQWETGGRNVWGGDKGSVNEHLHNKPVTDKNFLQFIYPVMNGAIPNGCSCTQITWAGKLVNGHRDGGLFADMGRRGLRPWVPVENMEYGFGLFALSHRDGESWGTTYSRYNGGPNPGKVARERGVLFDKDHADWMRRLRIR